MANKYLVLVNQNGNVHPHFYEVVAEMPSEARVIGYRADDQLTGTLAEVLADKSCDLIAKDRCYATKIGETDQHQPIKRLWLTTQPTFEQPKEVQK